MWFAYCWAASKWGGNLSDPLSPLCASELLNRGNYLQSLTHSAVRSASEAASAKHTEALISHRPSDDSGWWELTVWEESERRQRWWGFKKKKENLGKIFCCCCFCGARGSQFAFIISLSITVCTCVCVCVCSDIIVERVNTLPSGQTFSITQ